MASKGQVTLTFAGDSKSLERAFDRAGAGAKDMAADFDKAEGAAKSMASRVDNVGTTVGDQESKFMGAADLLDGLASAFGLNVGPMVDYARAAGDISGGIENLKGTMSGGVGKVTEYAKALFGSSAATTASTTATTANTTATTANTTATTAQTTATRGAAIAQGALNAVMNLNPAVKIALAVIALGAAVVIAYKESETFRRIVKGAFEAVKGPAQAAMRVVNGVVDAIKGVLTFLGLLEDKTTSTKEDVVRNFRDISAAARDSARASGATVPADFVGGRTLAGHHSGGVVAGPRGVPRAIMALGGERVLAPGQSGGASIVINVQALDPRAAASAVREALKESVRLNGPLVGVAA